jgi:hypothetical protein
MSKGREEIVGKHRPPPQSRRDNLALLLAQGTFRCAIRGVRQLAERASTRLPTLASCVQMRAWAAWPSP